LSFLAGAVFCRELLLDLKSKKRGKPSRVRLDDEGAGGMRARARPLFRAIVEHRKDEGQRSLPVPVWAMPKRRGEPERGKSPVPEWGRGVYRLAATARAP